jgi:hypothetical protein
VQPTSIKLPIQHSDDVPVPSIPFTAQKILQTSVDNDFSETRSENDPDFFFLCKSDRLNNLFDW